MTVRILTGDCRDVLRTLPDASVQCCVTSPPYYGLRDYGVDRQIGQEATPAEYVETLVSVFREVRRVLSDDGTLFLNLGDSYSHKNRMMIPATVAIAMREDGWCLRDEIVWHKPRTTPAPVKDRTVAAHEMVYLLSKKPTYFFDWEAIEEKSAYPGLVRQGGKAFRELKTSDPNAARKRPEDRMLVVRETRRSRSVWSISPSPYKDAHFATMPPDLAERCIMAGSRAGSVVLDPFGGAGTTALVADRLGRDAISIELNPAYVEIQRSRVVQPGMAV